MVFLHGTSIMHASAAGVPRSSRVRQVTGKDPSVRDFASYVPTEGAVAKIAAWQRRGAEICYLSSHQTATAAAIDGSVLAAYGFPAGTLYYRAHGDGYADVARRWQADVVVEDDCESIGGRAQTTASWLARSPGRRVPCVVVPEFGGLAHLPDEPAVLFRRVIAPGRRSRLDQLLRRARP